MRPVRGPYKRHDFEFVRVEERRLLFRDVCPPEPSDCRCGDCEDEDCYLFGDTFFFTPSVMGYKSYQDLCKAISSEFKKKAEEIEWRGTTLVRPNKKKQKEILECINV